jgi:hypothetical protein
MLQLCRPVYYNYAWRLIGCGLDVLALPEEFELVQLFS